VLRRWFGIVLLALCVPGFAVAQEAATEHGMASVYPTRLIGHRTSSGEPLDRVHLTAAHRRLPFGTIIVVTNRANGRSAAVRINDRGPHSRKFLIDLSPAAAAALGIGRNRSAPVEFHVEKTP
jgi:rare lipoprotein A